VTSLSSLNCANWPTNCEGSTGLVGSWFCSCATSNCRNMLFKLCPVGKPVVVGVSVSSELSELYSCQCPPLGKNAETAAPAAPCPGRQRFHGIIRRGLG